MTHTITVQPAEHQYKFVLEEVNSWNLHNMLDGSWARALADLSADDGWSICYLEGSTTGAFGHRCRHDGTAEWLFGIAKGNCDVGYLILEYQNDRYGNRDIEVVPHTSLPITLPLPELVALIKGAVARVITSPVSHLFIQPFKLNQQWRMGASTFDATEKA